MRAHLRAGFTGAHVRNLSMLHGRKKGWGTKQGYKNKASYMQQCN
jgi:hypothetical protein